MGKVLNAEELLEKYCLDIPHAYQVQNIALQLFDKTYDLIHNYDEQERRLLAISSLLHDIGYFVEEKKHNKHSYKLIKKNQLDGFNETETEIIANIARYHRGKLPKKTHKCFCNLSDKKSRIMVKKLSAMLRIADGLDNSHKQFIKNIECKFNKEKNALVIILQSNDKKCKTEINSVKKRKKAFEKEFSVMIKLKFEAEKK